MRKAQKTKTIIIGGNLIGCMCLKQLVRTRQVEIVTVIGLYHDNGCVISPRAWNASMLRVALAKKLPFMQPKNLEDDNFLEDLYQLPRPDYIITVQYDQQLSQNLLRYPRKGCINIHFSLQRHDSEHFPIQWAMVDNGPIGVTMRWLGNGKMNGDIIDTRSVDTNKEDTALSIYQKLTSAAYRMFKENFPLVLQGKSPRKTQAKITTNGHNSSLPYDRNIDWFWEADKIHRMVRALTFPPLPSARTFYDDNEIEILNPVEVIRKEKNGHNPGQIVDIIPGGLVVQTNSDCILIPKIRLNQSLVMNASKFCKQYNLTVGDCFNRQK